MGSPSNLDQVAQLPRKRVPFDRRDLGDISGLKSTPHHPIEVSTAIRRATASDPLPASKTRALARFGRWHK
jgi:hypothetical protein